MPVATKRQFNILLSIEAVDHFAHQPSCDVVFRIRFPKTEHAVGAIEIEQNPSERYGLLVCRLCLTFRIEWLAC